jgi:NADH-quinone oxidoreductase subunit N
VTVDFTVVLPELIVAITALVLIVADLYLPRSQRRLLGWLSIAGLAASFIAVAVQRDTNKVGFSGSVVMDGFSLFCDGVFLLAGILTLMMSMDYLELEHINLGEYYVLVLGALSGMMLMASANSLIVVFLSLELFSICLYVLAGFERAREVPGVRAKVLLAQRVCLGIPAIRNGAYLRRDRFYDVLWHRGRLENGHTRE